jgi:hypothetical protein
VFDPEHTWRYRVLLASFTHDPMGPLVRAVLGRNCATGAAYAYQAHIDLIGKVRANLRLPNGNVLQARTVGTDIAVRDEFRRLADHCKLTDGERIELFDELKKWTGDDRRVQAGIDIREGQRVI